jgi:membrane protease YdiL (CAAX protease family)
VIPEDLKAIDASVPWTKQDVWWTTSSLFIIMIAIAVVILLVPDTNTAILLIGGEMLLLVPVWLLGLWKYKLPWRSLGLREFTFGTLGLGCGLMIMSYGFNFAYSMFLAIFNLTMQPDFSLLFTDISSAWGVLIGGAVVAPIVEEIIFRGYIFAGLRNDFGWVKAAIISSLLFSIIHFQITAFIPIFILGMIFAYLYQRSNSIWPAIIMHVSTNTIALVAAFLASELSIL